MLTGRQIVDLYMDNGLPARTSVHIADSGYGLPARTWLANDFPNFFKDMLGRMGITKWTPRWDCDNYAMAYFSLAQLAHYQTIGSDAEGLAVGVVYYMAGARAEGGGGGGHAINTAVIKEDNGYKVVFIEPQYAAMGRSCIVELTQAEIDSIWFLNF